MVLSNVLHVKGIQCHFLSVSKLDEKGFALYFAKGQIKISTDKTSFSGTKPPTSTPSSCGLTNHWAVPSCRSPLYQSKPGMSTWATSIGSQSNKHAPQIPPLSVSNLMHQNHQVKPALAVFPEKKNTEHSSQVRTNQLGLPSLSNIFILTYVAKTSARL